MKTFQVPSRPLAAEAASGGDAAIDSLYGDPASPLAVRRVPAAGARMPRVPGIHDILAARSLFARRAMRTRSAPMGAPSAVVRTARRWSPGVVPPLVGGLLLACAVFIATQHTPDQAPAIPPETLLKLVVSYLLCGAIYGVLLYLAASDLVWLCVLLVGAVGYTVATVGVLWGAGVAVCVVALVAALAVWYIRGNGQIVPDGRVLVTGLAGGYARTLYPGRAVLAPFERELAILETTEQRFACPTQTTEVPNELGEIYIARAAALVAYSLIPSEAHHALALGSQWERNLRDLIPQALRQALGEWGAHILMGDEAPPDKLLGRTLLRELREQVRPYGIHVISVSVRDIWLVPEEELPALEAVYADAIPEAGAFTPAAERPGGAPLPLPLAALSSDAQPSQPGAARQGATVATALESAEALSPDVLSDAYEAVREGHINDPTTIRQIARAFLRVADDPARNADFPYDATAAARILLERALSVEHGR